MTRLAPESGAPRAIYAVWELNEILRALIEDALPSVWVRGEVSNFARPASGHWYFTLKDERGQIRCAMFRQHHFYVRPQPKDGDSVLVRARPSVYPARGELQLIVEHLEAAGAGALLAAFEVLKRRLDAEGLFDPALKRPLPERPRRIGLMTSATGAAVHDVLTVLARRWPLAEVVFYPVPVQGAEAAPAIVKALRELPGRRQVDVVLLVRGGGSIEDLWAFNEEAVARAIRACPVPVVSGVGHEVDVTIADFAADLRAPTPTAAAELATPDIATWKAWLDEQPSRLGVAFQQRIQRSGRELSSLRLRLLGQHPGRRLQDRVQRLDERSLQLERATLAGIARRGDRMTALQRDLIGASPWRRIERDGERLLRLREAVVQRFAHTLRLARSRESVASQLLSSLDPAAVLNRGYAIVRRMDGAVITDASAVANGERIGVQLARGSLEATRCAAGLSSPARP